MTRVSRTATRAGYAVCLDDVAYTDRVRRKAHALDSDGCTGVVDWYVVGCWDHDVAYATHADVDGVPITFELANLRLRWSIQHWSFDWNPQAWVRYAVVSAIGRHYWDRFRPVWVGKGLVGLVRHALLAAKERP